MHKLTIEDDEGKTVVVPLIRDEITVGRQDGNSIRLTERNVSRRHARFFRKDGQLYVEDLGSYTGIKVGTTRITTPTPLKDGDLVVIGDYKLTVRAERPTSTKLYGGGLPFAGNDGGTKPMPLPAGTASPAAAAPIGTAPLPLGGASAVPLAGAASATAAAPESRGISASGSAPAPDASLDAAPTIPVRTLAEQGLAAGDAPAAARLVVTATSLAGAEFSLDRPSLVIGRTPENDIVLNHKSISRHHAKIIRDGEKYIVVDLESANGVRVNGAEFERVELQSGDTLELGHVRMKFTSGNEYVDFDIGGGTTNKRGLLIGGAVAAFAVAGIVLSFAVGGNDAPKTASAPPAATKPAAAPATPPPATPPPAPTTAAAPPPPPPAVPATPPAPTEPAIPAAELEKLLADARAAMDRRKWSDATAKLDKVLAAQPTSADALAMKKTVDAEAVTMEKFVRLEAANRARNFEEINQIAAEIPENSVYRTRATTIRDSAAKRFVAARMVEVDRFVSRGACDDARREADRVLSVEPDNAKAKGAGERCDGIVAQKTQRETERAERLAAREEAAAAPREAPARAPEPRVPVATRPVTERPVAAPRPARPEPRPAAVAAAPPETGDPEELLQEAQQAWLKGQFASAIDSARRALRVRPNLPRAYQIIAVCSCSLRDADSATKAYDRLDERMRPLVKSACQKSGITLN
ncbi:MAG TPA: FHA domain-containing protein [Polyangia bacterium]